MIEFLSFLSLGLAQAEPPSLPDCSYDVDAMMALDLQQFDQDMDGGWRILSNRGCNAEAADLIREWRHAKRNHASILYWHEGQMRAFNGETQQAIALFELTYKSPELDSDFGWNHYVDGTIAFLTDDRERLTRAIEGLRRIPAPDDLTFTTPDGQTLELSWPPNMNVLQAFEVCWGRTYQEAYGTPECSAPSSE